jgi:GDP-L-fucose synthase
MIASNVINTSFKAGVKKLLYVGSSCIYPKNCPQPIKEEYFLSGDLEKTNEGYAIAKIAGIKLCQSYRKQYGANFICAMPTNSYGQNDKYDLENSHVLPAIIRKILEAKKSGSNKIELWGTGKPLREFIHVDDMADAILFLMLNYDGEEIVNVGTGEEVSISDLCGVIKKCADWDGEAVFNGNLDGTMRKILDCSKINSMGWQHKINLENGIKETLNDAEKYIDIWLPQS